jgi:hypothetical protein
VVVTAAATAVSIAAAAPAGAVSRIDHEAQCTWKQLTWDYFRGPIFGGQQAAWISATIVVEPVRVEMTDKEGGGAVARARNPKVYALMDKLESSAQKGQRTEENLSHEQVHFDIVEYETRRLWRELTELSIDGESRSEALQRELLLEVERRYGEALAALQKLQAQYDAETSHGRRAGAQRKWRQKATDLLASEKPYELR